MVIRDTLPVELNPASLRPGAASHPCTYTLRANGVAEFRFDNIMLPDSSTNQEESQGFVQFYIEQQPGNPNGAIIENSAAIYFDYEEPVITNYAWHTVDDGFLLPDPASIAVVLQNERGQALGDNTRVFLIQGQDTIAAATGGYCRFDYLPTGQTYTIAPYRNDGFLDGGYLNGPSTFDMVLFYKHILGIEPLDSPYQLLAADINYSGNITALDMVALRRMILAIDTEPLFPDDKPSWRFVRADYVFPDPTNPWLEPIPSTAVFDPLLYDETVEFIGIRLGDLSGGATAGRTGLENRALLPLRLEARQKEGLVEYQAMPAAPGEWIAYQMELQLPAGAMLRNVRPGIVAGELAYSCSETGRLGLCWYHTEAVRFAEGAPLFSLELAPSASFDDELFKEFAPGFSQAFTADGQSFALVLESREGQPDGLSVFPNPGSGAFTLSGNTDAREVAIHIYDLAGQTVYQAVAPGRGRWQYRLSEDALPAGVYTVEARAGGQRRVERIVVGR